MKITNNEVDLINVLTKPKKFFMYINVILTFDSEDKWGDSQDIFNLSIPLSRREENAVQFIHQKFFKRIVNKCRLLNRNVEDLIKISTAGDWMLFTEITGHESLPDLGHSCKWYFGNGRTDLDLWEKTLMRDFGFGTNYDMPYIDKDWLEATKRMMLAQ